VIEAMRRPGFFPHCRGAADLVQTHISYVFLAGEHVYKIKKPLRFSFLDFSTLRLRRHYCAEEVRLNRRLAPHMYRGVVSVCPADGTYRLAAEDDPQAIEYAVHMNRIPDDRILTALLDTGRVSDEMIDALADRLAAFHAAAAHSPAITANGDPERIGNLLEENFSAVRPFRDRIISAFDDDAIRSFSGNFLSAQKALFRRRQRQHRIRDCHGDLHSEHICFTDPLVIFDCIEFNERFRHCDVASEIAFLAMDLDYHERPDLAERFASHYCEVTGDAEVLRLLAFYKCYRAYVRGKVDSLKSAEEDVDPGDRKTAFRSAERHFALAYRYTWADDPRLVVIGGLSGTGKSTLASALSTRTGFERINSDVVRKELAGLSPNHRPSEAEVSWLYGAAQSERTYGALYERASKALATGRGVILDATFQRRADREIARSLASGQGVAHLIVECRASEEEVRTRLRQRERRGDDPSDADWNIHLRQREAYEPLADAETRDSLRLDTSAPREDLCRRIERALRARPPGDRFRLRRRG
jgi:aminoglycoside phosphotransferase family enzyme/predicted kinase